ncbi:MAG TPA: hypothetical protein ENI33_02490 [Thermoplasmatales archaeon]|nr:hypothetical protein [Thermoplasmatales archaeon]
MKFICDEMLGTLAKWLRIFGYDTRYAKDMDDEKIIEIALKEDRIVLTRDKMLSRKALKGLYIEEKDLKKQIERVVKKFKLDIEKNIFSRCTVCNIPVVGIERDKVKGKVPESVWKNNKEFWTCPKCGRIYWMGSHWENIKIKLKSFEDNLP